MNLKEFFNPPKKTDFNPTKITRGTWLTDDQDYLVCVTYIGGNFELVGWGLDGSEQGHHFCSKIPVDGVGHIITKNELEEVAACFFKYHAEDWRIVSNKEAGQIISRLPDTSI